MIEEKLEKEHDGSVRVKPLVSTPPLIFGETVAQAHNYARYKNMQRGTYIPIHDMHQLEGRCGDKFIKVGTWYNHRFAYEILGLARNRDMQIIEDDY